MSTPRERLASSLAVLNQKQSEGTRVFRSTEFKRADRERLLKSGFLEVAIRGWLVSSSPPTVPGDTTPWFASFWEFCSRYCSHRFDDQWHVSPELSLDLHGENSTVPKTVVVYSTRAQNNSLSLPHGTSLFGFKQKSEPVESDLTTARGVRVFRPEAALVRVPASYFARSPVEAEVALFGIEDPSGLLQRLLGGGNSTVAGRLAGAFRRLRRANIADEILSAMRSAGHDVRESDPFEADRPTLAARRSSSPAITLRLERLWASGRRALLHAFPPPPVVPPDLPTYLASIDDIYLHDAYHSLSIEGYRVTPELIARVASGEWDPDDESTRQDTNALAARGYYQAFQLVREAVAQAHDDPTFLRVQHRDWYRALFTPHVTAGLLAAPMLAGYRNNAVFLRGSRHMPPRWELLRHAMPTVFDLIDAESDPAARAILGHWLFGYVHPFPDGNGRVARLAMNALLAMAGYPWTVIRVDDRDSYLEALEHASVDDDLGPFVSFVAGQMEWSVSMTRSG